MIHDGTAYASGANFLYSDVTSARNTFENNVMYGTGLDPKVSILIPNHLHLMSGKFVSIATLEI